MRKYTLEYYLQIFRLQDTYKLQIELNKYSSTIVKQIQERYKKNSKGLFIDYITKHDDFFLITTYRIEDMLACAMTIVRTLKGSLHFQYYELMYSYPMGHYWTRHKFNHFNKRYLYSKNLQELFNDTEYKYSRIWELAEKIDVSARNFLGYCNSNHLHLIECFTELGLYKLAKDVINGKFYSEFNINIFKACGFKNFIDFEYVIKNDLSYVQMLSYRNFLSFGLPICYFKYFRTYALYHDISNIKSPTMSAKKIVQYYLSQVTNKIIKTSFENFLTDYKDYYRFGLELNYDFEDTKYYKPDNFKIAHDMAYLKYKSKLSLKDKKALYSVFKKQKTLVFKDNVYSLIVPKNAEDIILEGKNLKHCVGSYMGRIVNNDSWIFFIRHTCELETSFYTLELNPKTYKVVQYRGYGNLPTLEERKVKSFVKKWEQEILSKMRTLQKIG